MLRKIVAKLFFFLLQGLLLVVPLAATIYVIYQLFVFVDGLIPTQIPGLGLLLVLVLLVALGFLANTVIARPISNYFNRLLDKAPLLKTVYTAITDLLSAFLGNKKTFNKPVMVQLDDSGQVLKPGFITQSDLAHLGYADFVAVYLPHSYNFSGNVYVVAATNVKPISIAPADFMKFIVSGGVSDIQLK